MQLTKAGQVANLPNECVDHSIGVMIRGLADGRYRSVPFKTCRPGLMLRDSKNVHPDGSATRRRSAASDAAKSGSSCSRQTITLALACQPARPRAGVLMIFASASCAE